MFFPSGDSVGYVNTVTRGERERRTGVIGEVIFHVGESHLGLKLKASVSREQAEALTAACQFWQNAGMSHRCARAQG